MAMRVLYIVIFLCAVLTAKSAGQTTQPSPSAWNDKITHLAKTLTDELNSAYRLDALIPENALVQQFGSIDTESRYRVQQHASGLMVISVRTYSWPADTVASDLATDVENHDALPETIRRQFLIRDDASRRKANTVAQTWISELLQPAKSQFVAVIMLWEPQPLAVNPLFSIPQRTEIKQPLLILVKGEKDPRTDDIVITHLCYGDVRRALH